MAVSEQTDSLRVLGSDPVDYLITPRVAACMIAGPILNLMCFCMGAPPWALLLSSVLCYPFVCGSSLQTVYSCAACPWPSKDCL